MKKRTAKLHWWVGKIFLVSEKSRIQTPDRRW